MDNVTLVIAEDEMERQAVRYRDLEEQRRVLVERIERADSARGSVREPIYRKVRSEYETRLRAVEEELRPLASALEKTRASIEDEVRETALQDESLRDRLDELAFRHRVGEFDESAFEDASTPLEEERGQLARRQQELSERLSLLGSDKVPAPDTESLQNEDLRVDMDAARPVLDSTPTPDPAPERESTPTLQSTPGTDSAPTLDATPTPDPPPADDPILAPGPTSTPALSTDASASEPARAPATPRAEAEQADAFIDPSEWLGEFLPDGSHDNAAGERGEAIELPQDGAREHEEPHGREDKRDDEERPERRAARNDEHVSPQPSYGDAADQVESLADPGDDPGDMADHPASREAAHFQADSPVPELPILTIKSGPGAGKRLPLLPVTMTLGREVDNNIELKDKDVARYHARISYESGKYVIQDLEGSPGTIVNGQRVTKTDLSVGDVIRVGNTELSLDLA